MKISKMAFLALSITVALVTYAANRKVTIPVGKDGLTLVNGSDAAVSYNLSCHSNANVSLFSSNSQSLAAKAKLVLGSGNACVNSLHSSNVTTWSNAMSLCGPDVAFNSAAVQCASGYHLCTHAEIIANSASIFRDGWMSLTQFDSTYAHGNSTSTGSWSNSDQNISTATNPPYFTAYGYNYCSTGLNTAGSVLSNCWKDWGSNRGTFCCPDVSISNISTCTVEILSGGYLQSPQFKGNAPF